MLSDWIFKYVWLIWTHQSALFQHSFATLKNVCDIGSQIENARNNLNQYCCKELLLLESDRCYIPRRTFFVFSNNYATVHYNINVLLLKQPNFDKQCLAWGRLGFNSIFYLSGFELRAGDLGLPPPPLSHILRHPLT